MRFLIALVGGVLLGTFPAAAQAGGCHKFFVQKVVAVPIVQQQVYYSVGDDIRLNALAQKIVDRAGPQIAALVAQQLNAPQAQQQTAGLSPVLSHRCAACHNGTKARDFSGGMTPDEYTSFSKMLGIGEYPADGAAKQAMAPVIAKIQAENQIGAVIEAALRSVREPADKPPPPPTPSGGLE